MNEPELIVVDYLQLMAEGAKLEQEFDRELAKTNYLAVRDRKSKRERFR